jgi:hypothetical protein
MQHRAVYFNTEGMHITSMPLNKAPVKQIKDNTLQYPFIFDKHITPCTCILPVIRNNWPHLYPGLICKHPELNNIYLEGNHVRQHMHLHSKEKTHMNLTNIFTDTVSAAGTVQSARKFGAGHLSVIILKKIKLRL